MDVPFGTGLALFLTFMKIIGKKGFSLTELMIVVAIIGILAAIAIPQMQVLVMQSKRAEGFTIARGLYRAELSFYAANDTFGIPCGASLSGYTSLETQIGYSLSSMKPKIYSSILVFDDSTGCLPFGKYENPDFYGIITSAIPGLDKDLSTDQIAIQAFPGGSYGADCFPQGIIPCPAGFPVVILDDIHF